MTRLFTAQNIIIMVMIITIIINNNNNNNNNNNSNKVKCYCNADPTMAGVRSFEELAVQIGRHYIIKDAKKYAEQLDLQLWLNFPKPVAVADGKEVEAKKLKQAIYKAYQQEIQSTVSEERWQPAPNQLYFKTVCEVV